MVLEVMKMGLTMSAEILQNLLSVRIRIVTARVQLYAD